METSGIAPLHAKKTKLLRTRFSMVGFRLLLAVSLIAILWLALQPVPEIELIKVNDKLAHVVAFVVLAFLADGSWPAQRFNWIPAIWLAIYGALIELLQSLLEFRTASLADLVADVIGVLIYWFALSPVLRHRLGKNSRFST